MAMTGKAEQDRLLGPALLALEGLVDGLLDGMGRLWRGDNTLSDPGSRTGTA